MKNSKISIASFLVGFLLFSLLPDTAIAQNRNKRQNAKDDKVVVVQKQQPRTTPRRTVVTAPQRAKVTKVSRRANTIAYRGVNYRYHNGVFYKPYDNRFIVTRPPVGIRVNVLPANFINIWVGNRNYYYHDGIYYNEVGQNTYEVIAAPLGARISQLPPYNEIVNINGQQYYLLEGIYYQVVQERDGRLTYEVVGYA